MEKINNKSSGFGAVHSIIVVLQVCILVAVVLFWSPWNPAIDANTRKITITGTATIDAEPDQYQFNPSYTRDETSEITKLNNQIVTKLKSLGVADNQIENNASRYGSPEIYYLAPDDGKQQSTLSLTITVKEKELAQKVQNYLLTTNPEGTITPYASFSTAKQKELQDKVRNEAIADARSQAEKTASGLGTKIGRVLQVGEGANGGGVCSGLYDCPVATDSGSVSSREVSDKDLPLQPGTNEFTYNVTVVYALD